MAHECKYEEKINLMYDMIEKIDARTQKLLTLKNMIVGGFIVLAFMWSSGITMYKVFFK